MPQADPSRSVTLVGRVLDDRRAPVAGASVTVRTAPELAPIRCATSSDGRFQFELPEPVAGEEGHGAAALVVTDDRRVGQAHDGVGEYDVGGPRVRNLRETILVAPGGRIEVDVVDAGGAVADAVVEAHAYYSSVALAVARSDANGHAVIDPIPAGDFVIRAAKPGRGLSAVEARVVRGATCTVRVGLRPERTLKVEVVDTDDGRPIAGARIDLRRSAEGPNPGPYPDSNRPETCEIVPRRTDGDGRLELRGLEAESLLEIDARADHHAAHWPTKEPPEGAFCRVGEYASKTTRQVVSADAGAIRLEMKRRPRGTLRFTIDASSGPAPVEGAVLQVRQFQRFPWWPDGAAVPLAAVVVRGAVVVDCELLPGRGNAHPRVFWWASAAGGPIAELRPRPEGGDGSARFAARSSLEVTLNAPDGTPQAHAPVTVMHEELEGGERNEPEFSEVTDANGVVRFADLRAGRWIVVAEGIRRFVELPPGATTIKVAPPPLAEIVVEFMIGKERRLPANLRMYVGGEIDSMRREDPARGDVHLFVARPGEDREVRLQLDAIGYSPRSSPLPKLPEEGPLVVPIRLPERTVCEAVARLRGQMPDAIARWRPMVDLERRDDATGEFVFERLGPSLGPWPDAKPEVRWTDLRPGTYRLAIRLSPLHGEAVDVEEGKPPAELVLDATTWSAVELIWKVPLGECDEDPELEEAAEFPRLAPWWWDWEGQWPTAPRRSSSFPFLFDRASPPKLRIRHPYLVASRVNESIDLTKPRSALTLHAEPGPLVTMTPGLATVPREVEPGKTVALAPIVDAQLKQWSGAWISLADLEDPSKPIDVRRALCRGKTFAMAPPSAGRRRVLVDPVDLAPVELPEVVFDGGPRDLGEVLFAPGSTLTVHARATAPLAPPPVRARATRIDGIPYRRASREADTRTAPFDPTIRALGPGRFHVVVEESSALGDSTWTAEVTLDGVHDAELTILTD